MSARSRRSIARYSAATAATAAAAAALLFAAAPAAAQQLREPDLSRGPPPMRVHGHVIETRDQIYQGERAIAGFDVADAGHRPALAGLGERTAPEPVDRDELRAQRLALYGDAAPMKAGSQELASTSATKQSPLTEAPPPAGNHLAIVLGTGGTLLALGGILLAMRRQRSRAAAS